MTIPKQRIRVVAGTPIVIGDRRLLPSVLVTSLEGQPGGAAIFGALKMRPVSIVEEGPDGARWHAIPNETADVISVMLAVGAGVAVVSILIMLLAWLLRE
ncbi:MAG: hypothetical protein JXA33_01670 [Anaerolineae bacterium]|nr:hypothetical protein [Anaerolineae bacterium]